MKVGFIGLGIMGRPMAKNLVKAGFELVVFDFNKDAVDDLVKNGAASADNGKEVALKTDVVITMLPNSPNVESVLFDKNGIAAGITKGKTVIDMSSISPVESQKFSQILLKKGINFLDAPVSGGEPKAVDGTLSVMVGGSNQLFLQYEHLLKSVAGEVTYVGEVGAGNIAKLANQIIVAANIAAVSEALVFAAKAGVRPEKVFEAIRGGLAGSTVMEAKVPMMLDRNFEPGFRVDLHIKDLQNALDTSHEINVSLPLAATLMEMLQAIKIDGLGKDDHASILKFYEKINDITIKK